MGEQLFHVTRCERGELLFHVTRCEQLFHVARG